MSYTVLARRYRSATFEEVVGQEPIARTLSNAIASGRIHHGYLFSGTRGVGKTSMARILAKALNCQASDAPTTTPCGQCEICLAVNSGDDLDVIEIDAASNTGVDNIRELRSNAQYRPARARFKVYIIDEVHMLSTGAFNALLKTLEEPPSHVKFILCTTEPERVPATIHSRCQRFDFRAISTDKIAGQLAKILVSEGATSDEAVVRRVARLANGSMRDGLSLLDQVLSLGGGRLSEAVIDEILPRPNDELLSDLVDQWSAGDAGGALVAAERCLASGLGLERFCVTLIDHLRSLMLLAVCGKDTDLLDMPAAARDRMSGQCGQFDAGAYVYMISLLESLRRTVRFSTCGRALVDAAVVRLASSSRFSSIESLLGVLQGASPVVEPANRPAPTKGTAPVVATESVGSVASDASVPPWRRASDQGATSSDVASQADSGGRASRAQVDAVMKEPMVQKAMELFDGRLVDIQPSKRRQ